MSPDTCPNCGADLPRNARACPECGADEKTGWSEDAAAQHLDLPDDKFDYGEFIEREFGKKEQVKPRGVSWFWWGVAVALIVGFVALFVFSRR